MGIVSEAGNWVGAALSVAAGDGSAAGSDATGWAGMVPGCRSGPGGVMGAAGSGGTGRTGATGVEESAPAVPVEGIAR